MLRASAMFAFVVGVSCGGGKPAPQPALPPAPAPGPVRPDGVTPDRPPVQGSVAPAPPATVDRKPEVFPPAWKTVGVGQTISFATTAIDQDLDETRVEVKAMPPSARFDALTQTVTWTPTKAEMPKQTFELVVRQADRPGGAWTREQSVTFEIAVDAKQQPAPVAEPQRGVVETLLTIRQPARLHEVNLDWPIDKMLAQSAELFRATLPPEAQAKLKKRSASDKKALYRSFLAGLAETHDNKRLDPDDPAFDKAAFGSPRDWRIVTVRPRIDKKWQELRIVYQAIKAPEPVFAMFRLRPTWDVPTLPPEARERNNAIFSQLVARFLLGKEMGTHPRYERDAKAHGRQLAHFVQALMTYAPTKRKGMDPPPPWQRAAFVALPTEARMGGGSARDASGNYRSGDGWAWSVMKPMPTADGTSQAYVNMPIPGFWTMAVASPDGKSWAPTCAPRFHPDDPKHAPGYEVLCRKALGLVDLPATVDGKIAPSKRDAVNLFVEHKQVHSVAHLALDDGRRDHGEENGMTCAQCHIRTFGVRDYADPTTADPSAGTPKTGNKPLATLNFQIIPTTTWEAYTLDFMQDQECKGKLNLEKGLNQTSALTCPLAPK